MAIFGPITDISRDAITLAEGSARFDSADKRTDRYVALLEDLRRRKMPVYIETDPASGFVTRVHLPNLVRVESIREAPSGEISITFERSHARHSVKRDAEGDALLRTLREAGKDRWLAVTVNDRQEIIDVRPYDPPFDLPRLEPPPRLVWWHWCWWPWNWFRGWCCVSQRRAQQLFDLCAATTCDPQTVPPPCIPFMFPDNGCWARAHEMRRLMLNAGTTSNKVWIDGWLHTLTRNNPHCFVNWSWHVAPTICVRRWWWWPFSFSIRMVIDPSLFQTPVTEATWKSVQGDPNATLTDTAGWVFSRWNGYQPDPGYEPGPRELPHATAASFARSRRTAAVCELPLILRSIEMRQLALAVLLLGSALSASAVCPFNVAEVIIPPQQIAGFNWGPVIKPLNDACVDHIQVENANQTAWYVGGAKGVYVTKDNGVNWKKPLNGKVGALLWEPVHQFAYAGIGNILYFSRDHGANWVPVHTFLKPVVSLLAFSAQNTLYIGLSWDNHIDNSGIFTSNLGGGSMTFHPFAPNQPIGKGLIVWTISRDPMSGNLYAGTEIFDHQPQPYKPPFWRSVNNGNTWTNVQNNLPRHAVDSAVRPNGYVYALMEGEGVWGSSTMGNSWIPPNPNNPSLGVSLLMDPATPTRLYAGRLNGGTETGGIFRSIDAGNTFKLVGLKGATVSDIALNGTLTRIYVAAYSSGIYTSPVP